MLSSCTKLRKHVKSKYQIEQKNSNTKLRKKLSAASNDEPYIHTVWGRGYVLRDPENATGDSQS